MPAMIETPEPVPESAPEPAPHTAPQPAPQPLDAAACAAELKSRFPALFVGRPKPIKLRIHADIQARAPGVFTKPALSAFFRRHTGSTAYLIAMTQSAQRFDLDGLAAGEVSAEHRQIAADELQRRRGIREQREAEAQSQQRDRAALLRAFETTTLTPANFCALKGVTPEVLEAQLDLARRERDERPVLPEAQMRARPSAPPPRQAPNRPQERPQERPHERAQKRPLPRAR